MFDIKSYHLHDPAPGVQLETIYPVSIRALALLVRNKEHPILKTGFLNIYGAVDMMDGLQYHHDNFLQTIQILTTLDIFSVEEQIHKKQLRHEMVAYLNRLGQLYYFAKSSFVANHLPNSIQQIPTINKFILFRNKHGAHRSLDAPRKEDSIHQQQLQAWALSSVSGLGLIPKDNSKALENFKKIADPKIMWGENYIMFQMRGRGQDDFVSFSLEQEHPQIILEAFNLIVSLLAPAN